MKDLLLSVFNIFMYAGRFLTAIRNTIVNLLILILLVIWVTGWLGSDEKPRPNSGILRLDLTGRIVEQKRITGDLQNYIGRHFNTNEVDRETELQDILDTIALAADDPKITSLLLNLKDLRSAGLNQLQTVGKALQEFKKSGKRVVAAEDYYTQSQYFLASYADTVILNPMGFVDIHGFGNYRLYFRDALEKLKIKYSIFKVGQYKSALEPFTRNNMSEPDRKQNQEWLSGLWSLYRTEITKQRHLSPDVIANYTNHIDQMLRKTAGDSGQLALQTGLVDKLMTRQDIQHYLKTLSGTKPHFISSSDYLQSKHQDLELELTHQNKIGVLVAEGNILPGKQPIGRIGSDSLSQLIQKAGKNDSIKGLVLRINSPGGSAFASEIIRQELLEFKKTGKPLVVSMGSYAASGGYWIGADADEIWASPATITGSIGIFGAIPNFSESLRALGVYSDGTGTTPLSAGLDVTRELPLQLQNAIQQNVEHGYNQFLNIVAKGRDLPLDTVRRLASGRVYDGVKAKEIGLVDQLGNLEEAIESAAELAKLEEYDTEYLREKGSVEEQLLEYLFSNFQSLSPQLANVFSRLARYATVLQQQLEPFNSLDDPNNVFAHSLLRFNN